MKRIAMLVMTGLVLTLSGMASADSEVPPLPTLSAEQAARVARELARYRADTEARVGRGEITPDESELLIAWREWQLAQQAAGLAPRPPQIVQRQTVVPVYPYAPYYGPYYAPAPYYYGPPAPAYWGLSLCAGRAWGSGFGSLCI